MRQENQILARIFCVQNERSLLHARALNKNWDCEKTAAAAAVAEKPAGEVLCVGWERKGEASYLLAEFSMHSSSWLAQSRTSTLGRLRRSARAVLNLLNCPSLRERKAGCLWPSVFPSQKIPRHGGILVVL